MPLAAIVKDSWLLLTSNLQNLQGCSNGSTFSFYKPYGKRLTRGDFNHASRRTNRQVRSLKKKKEKPNKQTYLTKKKVNSTFKLVWRHGFGTRMVTRWPEATAMRLSSDQAMALGKDGEPKSNAGCNGQGQGPGRAILCVFLDKVKVNDWGWWTEHNGKGDGQSATARVVDTARRQQRATTARVYSRRKQREWGTDYGWNGFILGKF